MSITSRIESIKEHIGNAYDSIEALGVDITDIDKNIKNISSSIDGIYDTLPKVTDEGESITLDGTIKGRLKTTLKGNTSQNGTPTPDTPIPVNVVSGDNTISITGKNLFDNTLLNQEENYNTYNSSTNKWTTNSGGGYARSILYGAIGANSNRNIAKLIKLLPNKTHTLTFYDFTRTTTDNNYLNLAFFDNTGVMIGSSINTKDNPSFTAPNQECYLDIRRGDNSGTFTFSNIQIEVENSSTPYDPYTGATYPINLPEGMELCKIPNTDYEDIFIHDKTLDKWYLHKEIRKITTYNGETIITDYISTTGQLTTGATIYYGLSTSTDIEITYQPLIEQLNAIEKAISYNGQTNISQVNNDLPFIINTTALIKNSD